jgi:pantoate--beta-alanine ligase
MREGRRRASRLVASIFVNPLQFAAGEDLDRYPRNATGDATACDGVGVDVLFMPEVAALYPDGFQTRVQVGRLGQVLCGASRPGHFDGVATVVLKLFNLAQPDVAVFGCKDYQQLAVIRRMVRDLDLAIEIVGLPTVREPDGLAMSSRNSYLDPDQRSRAVCLSRALDAAERLVARGERRVESIVQAAAEVVRSEPIARIDYVDLVGADDLEPLCELERPGVLALAVRIGATRLIDNRVLVPPSP